jgi:hypothetical protein
MKVNLRSGLVLLAVAMHLAVPVMAYGQVSLPALPGDFCSTLRSDPVSPAGGGFPSSFPLPASGEHHCAHAPCCAGGAVSAATAALACRLSHCASRRSRAGIGAGRRASRGDPGCATARPPHSA